MDETEKKQRLDEFNAKFQSNIKYEGLGLETTMIMPCPFCAEPDFMPLKIIESEEIMKRGAVCNHCKRGMKAIFNKSPGMTSFHLVQTEGDDPPEWLPATPRI